MRITTTDGQIDALRALHVIDIENLLLGRVTPARVAVAWAAYLESTAVAPHDQVYVGFCATTAKIAAFSLPRHGLRIVIGGHGADSAETALLSLLPAAWVSTRFARVTIASADHAFAPWAHDLALRGVHLTQVLPPSGTSAVALRHEIHASTRLRSLAA